MEIYWKLIGVLHFCIKAPLYFCVRNCTRTLSYLEMASTTIGGPGGISDGQGQSIIYSNTLCPLEIKGSEKRRTDCEVGNLRYPKEYFVAVPLWLHVQKSNLHLVHPRVNSRSTLNLVLLASHLPGIPSVAFEISPELQILGRDSVLPDMWK